MYNFYLCEEKYTLRKNFTQHLRFHQENGDKIFPAKCLSDEKCKNCEYFTIDALNRHIRLKHETNKIDNSENLNCDNNNFSFVNRSDINKDINFENENFQFDSNATIFREPIDINNLIKKIQNKIFIDVLSLKSKSQLSDALLN